jgi:hypothetical protein
MTVEVMKQSHVFYELSEDFVSQRVPQKFTLNWIKLQILTQTNCAQKFCGHDVGNL